MTTRLRSEGVCAVLSRARADSGSVCAQPARKHRAGIRLRKTESEDGEKRNAKLQERAEKGADFLNQEVWRSGTCGAGTRGAYTGTRAVNVEPSLPSVYSTPGLLHKLRVGLGESFRLETRLERVRVTLLAPGSPSAHFLTPILARPPPPPEPTPAPCPATPTIANPYFLDFLFTNFPRPFRNRLPHTTFLTGYGGGNSCFFFFSSIFLYANPPRLIVRSFRDSVSRSSARRAQVRETPKLLAGRSQSRKLSAHWHRAFHPALVTSTGYCASPRTSFDRFVRATANQHSLSLPPLLILPTSPERDVRNDG